LAAAALELERMPARDRRKVLSVYAALCAYRAKQGSKPATKKERANV
jgi:hypothetical protein